MQKSEGKSPQKAPENTEKAFKMAIFQCFGAFPYTAGELPEPESSIENMRIFKASGRVYRVSSLYKQKDSKTTQKRL